MIFFTDLKKSIRPFLALTASAAVFVASCPAYAVTAAGANAPAGAAQAAPAIPPAPTAPAAETGLQSIRIVAAAGAVEVRSAGSDAWRPVQTGDTLQASDTLRTGPDGNAAFEFDGAIRMQILADSELVIEEARRGVDQTRQTLLNLQIGKIKADVDPLASGSSFVVKTPTAVSAVRGTTLYLSVIRFAQGLAGIITDLYVDKGKVDFAALDQALNGLLVEALHTSSIGGDGETTPARELSPEERAALIDAFEKAFEQLGNPQFGVETGTLPGAPGGATIPAGGSDPALRDALGRLIDELIEARNEDDGTGDEGLSDLLDLIDDILLESAKEAVRLLADGIDLSGDFDFDRVSDPEALDQGVVSDERTAILNEALEAQSLEEVEDARVRLQEIRDEEKNLLRDTLDSILDDQRERGEDADQERAFDAQTGKVMTDVHGNRVRVDQYIYHAPQSNRVLLVSMTLRTGEYQNGISSVAFGVLFNNSLAEGTVLRDLPWNDYLSVVTGEQFNERYLYGDSAVDDFDQFIVHESSGANEPEIYPVDLYAEFQNPNGDRIRFDEGYSDPISGVFAAADAGPAEQDGGEEGQGEEFGALALQEGSTLWYQARTSEETRIEPVDSDPIEFGRDYIESYEDGNWSGGCWEEWGPSVDGRDGSQTTAFAGSEVIGQLDSPDIVNILDNIGANHDGDPDNDVHPAYFSDEFENDWGGRSRLIGLFIPIDNLGRVIDQPGFRMHGLRDLVNPNSLVAGGEYNLETILIYGETGYDESDNNVFEEQFRIDTIITPEIFEPYGIGASRVLFPDRLIPDDDDTQ